MNLRVGTGLQANSRPPAKPGASTATGVSQSESYRPEWRGLGSECPRTCPKSYPLTSKAAHGAVVHVGETRSAFFRFLSSCEQFEGRTRRATSTVRSVSP